MKKNTIVALCGESGCGKSSIIALIQRWYQPLEGTVRFSGVDIRTLDPKWYKEHVAIVQQEPCLFDGSIRENICYGLQREVTDDEIYEVCQQANAHGFITDKTMMPMGLDTIVGERGVKLSGGQKQRVAVARALIRKAKLILLDEATSALDAESEYQVQKALDNLMKSGN